MKKFTKKESQVMDVLWTKGEAMIAAEIAGCIEGMSVYSVQQVLSRLLEDHIVQVTGIGHNRNAIARQYQPVMEEAEYLASIVNSQETTRKFTEHFVEVDASLSELEKLQSMIQARMKELKKDGA